MKASEFINVLGNNPDLPLSFEYKEGSFARADFHLTEFKNVTFDTVDCGGVQNNWQEVHVQLWENEIPEPNHRVDTSKAFKIFQDVAKVRPNLNDVELKFEYGNANFHAAILPVGAVEVLQNQIIVKLGEEKTCCKAKDRATTPEEKAVACCSPVSEVAQKPLVNLSNLMATKNNSCEPGGGCC